MMTRHFLLVGLAAVGLGCGPSSRANDTRTPEAALASPMVEMARSLPPETTMVFAVSLQRVRGTPAWSALGQPLIDLLLSDNDDLARGLADVNLRCGLDPVRDIEWGILALETKGDPENGVMLVGGNFTRAKFDNCVTAMGWERKQAGAITEIAGVRLGWIDNTLVVAFDEDGAAYLQRVVTPQGPGPGNPGLAEMMAKVDTTAAAWVAGMLTQERSIYKELDLDGDAIAGYGSLDLAAEATARVTVRFVSADSAGKAARNVRGILEEVKQSPAAVYFDTAKIDQAGTEVTASVHIDKGRVDSLVAMARGAIDRQAAENRERRNTPPPPPVDYDALAREEEARKQAEADAAEKARQEAAAAEANAAQTKADNERKAKAHTKQGIAYRDAGLDSKAIEEFWAAYQLVPQAELLYNIGLSFDSLKNPERAIEYYNHYLTAEPEGRAANKARQRIAKLTRQIEKQAKKKPPARPN